MGDPRDRASVISFTIQGVHPHDIATILDENGVAIRAITIAVKFYEKLGVANC